VAKPLARPTQARHDGTDGNIESFRHFSIRKVFHADEEQDGFLVLRNRVERRQTLTEDKPALRIVILERFRRIGFLDIGARPAA
jgi:hypothetical protein